MSLLIPNPIQADGAARKTHLKPIRDRKGTHCVHWMWCPIHVVNTLPEMLMDHALKKKDSEMREEWEDQERIENLCV